MNTVIEQMLKEKAISSVTDKKNALKEIIQEITLIGLSRGGFFSKAAFYGGTALRIFYDLDRFSEDLDFSLMEPDHDFELEKYFPYIERELKAYGLELKIEKKEKSVDSFIKSAFIKGNTKEHLLKVYDTTEISIPKNEMIKIKFEVDIDPPGYVSFERRYRLLPSPYEVNIYDGPSLFAGKLHAVLCRGWKNRVKGRDLYDYIFYLSRGIKYNGKHLKERLIDSGFIKEGSMLSEDDVKDMLIQRFEGIDYDQAKRDVISFINDPQKLDIWSKDFFVQITGGLEGYF